VDAFTDERGTVLPHLSKRTTTSDGRVADRTYDQSGDESFHPEIGALGCPFLTAGEYWSVSGRTFRIIVRDQSGCDISWTEFYAQQFLRISLPRVHQDDI